VFSTARLCRPCRQRERAQREQARLRGGDPNPYKNPGLLLAKIRVDIEPKLLSAGYRLVGRSRRRSGRAKFIDYGRSEDLFTLSWDQHEARLTAELLTGGGTDLREIAAAEFSGVQTIRRARSAHPDIEGRLAPFMASVHSFLDREVVRASEPESQ
jgi:hypothetical protein